MGAVAASLGAALPALRQHFDVGAAQGGSLVSLFNLGSLAVIGVCGFGQRRLEPAWTAPSVSAALAPGGGFVFPSPHRDVPPVVALRTGAGRGGPGPSLS